MPNSSQIVINEIDLSFTAGALLKGISFVEGVTKRGPILRPDLLMSSWEQFVKTYGGYISNSTFPLLCRRAFDLGCQLRVNRVVHFSDITDDSTSTADTAETNKVKKITLDAALIASNTIAVTINGGTPITALFATNSNATLAAWAADIAADPLVEDCQVVNAGAGTDDDRVVLIWPKTTALTLTALSVTGGASQAGVTQANAEVITSAGNECFEPTMKYPGGDYNNVKVVISDATNGSASYFNLSIEHTVESDLNELYENLTIPTTAGLGPNVTNSHYLDDIIQKSQLLGMTYKDLSAVSSPRPANGTYYFSGGDDGDAIVATDYVGDSAGKTGFYSFNTVDDGYQIAAPEIDDTTVHIGGVAYAAARKDLVYFAHLSNDNVTASDFETDRQTVNADSNYAAFFGGGLKVINPLDNNIIEISELGDVLGLAAANDSDFGEQYSFAGTQRGKITNALGVVRNFGTAGNANSLNLLANRQINMVIAEDNMIYLKGNFTGQLASSRLSFLNTRRFLLKLRKQLGIILKRYLEQPLDIETIREIHSEVKPILDDYTTARQRALYSYNWVGGQQYSTIEEVIAKTSNTAPDIDLGKYKVRLFLKIIPSMQEIGLDIVITSSGVNISEV